MFSTSCELYGKLIKFHHSFLSFLARLQLLFLAALLFSPPICSNFCFLLIFLLTTYPVSVKFPSHMSPPQKISAYLLLIIIVSLQFTFSWELPHFSHNLFMVFSTIIDRSTAKDIVHIGLPIIKYEINVVPFYRINYLSSRKRGTVIR